MHPRSHLDERLDYSRWLIHFVSDRDCSGDVDAPLEDDADAFAVLLNIIKEGLLRASWSVRDGKPTVWGDSPVVCFTEMPLQALIRYSKSRPRDRVGVCGVAVERDELFRAGARPAIYGLSGEMQRPRGRVLDERLLPLMEQYRYVHLNPGRGIDWTHEREWRWKPRPGDEDHTVFDGQQDWIDVPGLSLFSGLFCRVAVLVQTPEEADRIANRLVVMSDSYQAPNSSLELEGTVAKRSFVVVMDEVERLASKGDLRAYRLDSLPDSCCRYVDVEEADELTYALVEEALREARETAKAAALAWKQEHADFHSRDGYSFVWLVTYDATSPVTRALLHSGEAIADGSHYRLERVVDLTTTDGMNCAETAAGEAAREVLEARLGQAFYIHRVWD